MRVHSSLFQPSTLFAKSGQTAAKKAAEQPTGDGSRVRDRVSLSPQGKLMSSIQQLTDQKKSLMENKRNLIARTMEEGGDMKAIEGQLDVYTQQMEEIDKQVSQLTADFAKQMAEKATQKDEEKKSADKSDAETDTDIQRLSNLAGAVDQIQQAESVAAVQDKVDGSARVKDAEVHLGELEVRRNEDKEPDSNLEHVIARMKADVAEQAGEADDLHTLARDMGLTVSQQLKAAQDQIEADTSAGATEDAPANVTETETADAPSVDTQGPTTEE